jgi:hypothetical protein
MEIWVALVGGIIIGWVVEWVVDWLYWRRGVEAFYATEAELRSQVSSLTAENEELRQQLAPTKGADSV